MSLTGLVAARCWKTAPLRQPKYSMRDVPRSSRDLSHSSLYHITNREDFNNSMAEFVLLCNEATRRQAVQKKSKMSKPLSLEYMADRLDVDDPVFGFMVRTDKVPMDYPSDQLDYFQKGMLQGFITVTTFTNWQKSFRWDSLHDSACAYDDEELRADMSSRKRAYDHDGSLSAELQNTVRCGNVWNEGIVWPKIAEISLLGALGCGRALLSLMIERLEAMPPCAKTNYDYVVLQATENSVPFYESMGFVRVGCVTDEEYFPRGPDSGDDDGKEEDAEAKLEIVSSPTFEVITKKRGETAADYAKKYEVCVWDIIFLSHFLYPDLTPRSPLMPGTVLYIPDKSKYDGYSSSSGSKSSGASPWYFSLDNETPREIAKKFNLDLKDLLAANERIEDLKANSRLIEGTRIQVTSLDKPAGKSVPYCHWTFPDSKFEDGEPSYMMARKLNRKSRVKAKLKPVENSFAVKVQEDYDSASVPTSAIKAPVNTEPETEEYKKTPKKVKKRKRHPEQPRKPKKPATAYLLFFNNEKERLKNKNVKVAMPDLAKITSQHWKVLPEHIKTPFLEKNRILREKYEKDKEKYEMEMEIFKEKYPDWEEFDEKDAPSAKKKKSKLPYKDLFNKVVKLNKQGQREARSEFKYFYVLTYIPDLYWCHLAPLKKVGVFGPNKKKVEGRTKWMLVDEGEGKELDITGAVCEVVKSRTIKGCADADKEEWDIVDGSNTPKQQHVTMQKGDDPNTDFPAAARKPLTKTPKSFRKPNENVQPQTSLKIPARVSESDTASEADTNMTIQPKLMRKASPLEPPLAQIGWTKGQPAATVAEQVSDSDSNFEASSIPSNNALREKSTSLPKDQMSIPSFFTM